MEVTVLPAELCRACRDAVVDALVCRCLSHRARSFSGALLGPLLQAPERSPVGLGVNPAPSLPILPLDCEVSGPMPCPSLAGITPRTPEVPPAPARTGVTPAAPANHRRSPPLLASIQCIKLLNYFAVSELGQ